MINPSSKRTVSVKTIDEYNYNDVDLIKIDVEGAEYSVIEGAINTIKCCKPLLIVEIEQRHISQPIENVFELITNLEYVGYFLLEGELLSLHEFDYAVHQEPYLGDEMNKSYVNNFIFMPS